MRSRNGGAVDTLTLQVDELRSWIENPKARGPSEQWSALAGELVLNGGALEDLVDRFVAHYAAGASPPAEFYRKPWTIRRAHLVDLVRRGEPALPRRSTMLDLLRRLDDVLDWRTRLVVGRPRLKQLTSLPGADDEAYVELTHWTVAGPRKQRLDYRRLATLTEQSREYVRLLDGLWAELPEAVDPLD